MCEDKFVTYLKDFGYNVVRLPKADMQPLQVYSRQGNDLNRLGELTSLLRAGDAEPLPPIQRDIPASKISGQRTADLSIGVALTILGGVIKAMGGNLGIDAQYKNAKSAVFEFDGVLQDEIDVLLLDRYLGNADIQPHSVTGAQLLEHDQIYITTAVIKSQKFTVEARQSDGASLKVDVPVIKEVVGANVTIKADNDASTKVTYEGKIPLVFGFQAVQLFYTNGRYTAFQNLPPGNLPAMALKPNTGATPGDAAGPRNLKPVRLRVDNGFVRLHS